MLLKKLLWLSIALCFFAQAQQLQFDKTESEDSITLQYRWRDHFDHVQQLQFSLPKAEIQAQYVNTKSYRYEIAQRYVYISLLKEIQKIDPREARIRLQKLGNDIRVSVSSDSGEMVNKWRSMMQNKQTEAFDQYLDDNHYVRFQTHLGEEGVKHDHVQYLQDSIALLMPVAQAIYAKLESGTDARDYVNLLLGWIQSIPYDTLENRMVSNGAGYSSPLQVLLNNQGDCDSKTVLLATLMRALLPQISMQMVFLPNHALLAANLPHRDNERIIEINKMRFMLLEPTGPAMLLAGQVASISEQAINSARYVTERVP